MTTNYIKVGTSYKLTIVGDGNTGKSNLLNLMTGEDFTDRYISTIGCDYRSRGQFKFWDTAGQERFRTIVSSYYTGTHCVFIVYDVSTDPLATSVTKYIDEIKKHCSKTVRYVIVGNKTDLIPSSGQPKEIYSGTIFMSLKNHEQISQQFLADTFNNWVCPAKIDDQCDDQSVLTLPSVIV